MRTGLSWLRILADLFHFVCLGLRSRSSLAAENLFLRKQLAFYQERKVKPRRADNPTRLTLVLLSRWFNWRDALIVVKPKTLVAWHRKGFQLFWHRKSKAGRRRIPVETPTFDSKNGTREPLVGRGPDRKRATAEARSAGVVAHHPEVYAEGARGLAPWTSGRSAGATFLKNHARVIVACDFCVASDRDLPNPLCVGGDGARFAPIASPRRDVPSDHSLDTPTVARSHSPRSRVSLHHP